MSKTIKELADELGVSKSGIRKYMTPSFRFKYTFKNANHIFVKDAGIAENKIKQLENKDNKSETEKLDKENPESNKKGFWKNLFS